MDLSDNGGKLLILSDSLRDNYKYLATLEYNGEKGTTVYLETISNIEALKKVEDQFFEELFSNEKQFLMDYNYLTREMDVNKDNDNELDFLLNNRAKNNELRLITRMQTKIRKSIGVSKEITKLTNEINNDYNNTKFYNHLYEYAKYDFYETLLFMINKYINDPKYEKFKKELYKLKYKICFLNVDIENEHIKDEFKERENYYLSSQIYSDAFNMSKKEHDFYISDNLLVDYEDYAIETLIDLLPEVFDDQNELYAFISMIVVRASFVRIPIEDIMEDRESLQSSVLDNNIKNPDIERYMGLCFENIEEDKKDPLVLSLRKNN